MRRPYNRLANISDSTSTGFHPCTSGGNETVETLFDNGAATCDDQFLKLTNDGFLTAKNGSYLIVVSIVRFVIRGVLENK